jgi:hypothetical protein
VETVAALSEVLLEICLEAQRKVQSKQSKSRPRLEPAISRIRSRNAAYFLGGVQFCNLLHRSGQLCVEWIHIWRRNSSCCLVQNKYQLNVFLSQFIAYHLSSPFTFTISDVTSTGNSLPHLTGVECHIQSQHLSTHSERCARMKSCTWHRFLFAAIHSELLLPGTCLKDSACVDENTCIIWRSL